MENKEVNDMAEYEVVDKHGALGWVIMKRMGWNTTTNPYDHAREFAPHIAGKKKR